MDPIIRFNGIYRAIVHDNRDPDNLRRLKVRVTTTGDEITDWVWPVISTKRPPAIGTGVYVMYLGGDPEYPVWVGEFGKEPQGLFSYGSWYSTVDQSTTTNTATAATVNAKVFEEDIKVEDGSKFTVKESGTYNVQFSMQMHHTGGGGTGNAFYVWFRKNGTDIADSATRYVVSNNTYEVAIINLFVPMVTDDYVQIMWATDNASIRLEHLNASSPYPAIPSVIVTINQIA